MKLMPAAIARWMMRTLSPWSGLPQAPNIIAPRQSGETLRPVLPRLRYSMLHPRFERPVRDGRTLSRGFRGLLRRAQQPLDLGHPCVENAVDHHVAALGGRQ